MAHNTWIHWLARLAVRPLRRTAVTPNHVTTARLVVGLAAAAAFGVGRSPWHYAGSGLFLVSMLLDRADGELARLTGRSSRWGHRYDLVADAVANACTFLGIAIGLRESLLGLWALLLGGSAGAGIGAVLWLMMQAERHGGIASARLESLAGGLVDADDALLVVPVAVALGASLPVLVGAAVGTPLFALWFFRHLRRRRQARALARG